MKRVFIFSTPFAFGPTGTALALLDTWREMFEVEFTLVVEGPGVQLCKKEGIDFLQSALTSTAEIEALLLRERPDGVISSLNAWAIEAGSNLGIPTALIDSLTWFWQKPYPAYLLADHYFALRFPGVEQASVPTARVVSNLGVGQCRARSSGTRSGTLINLSGVLNPVDPDMPADYLQLIIDMLHTNESRSAESITVTGNHLVLDFIKSALGDTKVKFCTYARKEFVEAVSQAAHCITVPGYLAPLEAFSAGTPTSFLPPLSLSQWRFIHEYVAWGAAPRRLLWEDYIDVDYSLRRMSDEDSVGVFPAIAKRLRSDAAAYKRARESLSSFLHNPPTAQLQTEFSQMIGVDGAREIGEILAESWLLPLRNGEARRFSSQSEVYENNL